MQQRRRSQGKQRDKETGRGKEWKKSGRPADKAVEFRSRGKISRDRKQAAEERRRRELVHGRSAPSELTFDRGDDGAGRAEDVHRVEALVFADDDLQHSQHLAEAFVDCVVQALVVVLCRENNEKGDQRSANNQRAA